MSTSVNRKLDAFTLAAFLVSAHYGLGFLLGTAEQSLTLGAAGSLYPVCLSLGTIILLVLAKFYWIRVEQIWTLLGDRYGNGVKIGIGLMSWASYIGIEAVQIISGGFILKVLGMPVIPSMIILAILFACLSLLPVEKAGFLFRGFLILNFIVMLYGLSVLHGFSEYGQAPIEFIPSLQQMNSSDLIGVAISTILLFFIDMKYHQFIVQAKDLKNMYKGCLLAALLLLLLAFLPSAIVIAAQNNGILPPNLNGKETLPFILSWIGGGTNKPLGILLIMSLLVPALGVGSNILRVQTKTILDFKFLHTSNSYKIIITTINAILSLLVAFKGGEIVSLIVSFYAAYIAAVSVPFIAYLVEQSKQYYFSKEAVNIALFMGGISSISILTITLVNPRAVMFGNVELNIMIVGILFGILGLLFGQVIEKYTGTTTRKET